MILKVLQINRYTVLQFSDMDMEAGVCHYMMHKILTGNQLKVSSYIYESIECKILSY